MTTKKTVVDQVFGDNKAPVLDVLNADYADLTAEANAVLEGLKSVDLKIETKEQAAVATEHLVAAQRLGKKVDGERIDAGRPMLDAKRAVDGWFGALINPVQDEAAKIKRGLDGFVQREAERERAKALEEAKKAEELAAKAREREANAKSAEAAGNAAARAEELETAADAAAARSAQAGEMKTSMKTGAASVSSRQVWSASIVDYQAAIGPLGSLGMFLKRDAVQAALDAMAKQQQNGAAWPGVRFTSQARTSIRAR